MSRQINLLIQQRDRTGNIALLALLGLGALLLVLLAYWGSEHFKTLKLQNTLEQDQHLLAVKAEKQAVLKKLAEDQKNVEGGKVKDIGAEIAALKQRSEANQSILDMLKKGELGSPDGYAGHLAALASLSDNNSWLTSVAISNAGKNVNLTGRALNDEAILRYSQRLNQQFAGYGVQFTSVEMTTEVFGKESSAAPSLSTVVFKLF